MEIISAEIKRIYFWRSSLKKSVNLTQLLHFLFSVLIFLFLSHRICWSSVYWPFVHLQVLQFWKLCGYLEILRNFEFSTILLHFKAYLIAWFIFRTTYTVVIIYFFGDLNSLELELSLKILSFICLKECVYCHHTCSSLRQMNHKTQDDSQN